MVELLNILAVCATTPVPAITFAAIFLGSLSGFLSGSFPPPPPLITANPGHGSSVVLSESFNALLLSTEILSYPENFKRKRPFSSLLRYY